MINVTKAFLPPQDEYQKILSRAWSAGWLTNRGQLVTELEYVLQNRFDIDHVLAIANGTISMQIAIKALQLKGEIITTAFSYVATSSSIVWEGCKPIFVDIEENYLTIDPKKIEEKITDKTQAILATHVFGNPCDVTEISRIAQQYNLKVIYDAAHCFGVHYKGKSIFKYGDISSCSFHATKVFHTGEGGALFTNSKELYDICFYHHNFGHNGHEEYHGLGINGKMSELQAAMGLAVLPYFEKIVASRKEVIDYYNNNIVNPKLKKLRIRELTDWNYSYYPLIFESEEILIVVQNILEQHKIYGRRYFFPSLNKLPYVEDISCPVSESITRRILCLPLYVGLEIDIQQKIVNLLNRDT